MTDKKSESEWKMINVSPYLVDRVNQELVLTGEFKSIPRAIDYAIRKLLGEHKKQQVTFDDLGNQGEGQQVAPTAS